MFASVACGVLLLCVLLVSMWPLGIPSDPCRHKNKIQVDLRLKIKGSAGEIKMNDKGQIYQPTDMTQDTSLFQTPPMDSIRLCQVECLSADSPSRHVKTHRVKPPHAQTSYYPRNPALSPREVCWGVGSDLSQLFLPALSVHVQMQYWFSCCHKLFKET